MARLILDEQRVYRSFSIPISAFRALVDLKDRWSMGTNAEVVTRLLLEKSAESHLMEDNDDDSGTDTNWR